MIHSKESSPNQVFEFSKKFGKSKYFKPLVAVPSSYSKTSETKLVSHGFKIIIYANHLMRASYPAMINTAKKILNYERSFEAEKNLSSISEVINLIKT